MSDRQTQRQTVTDPGGCGDMYSITEHRAVLGGGDLMTPQRPGEVVSAELEVLSLFISSPGRAADWTALPRLLSWRADAVKLPMGTRLPGCLWACTVRLPWLPYLPAS